MWSARNWPSWARPLTAGAALALAVGAAQAVHAEQLTCAGGDTMRGVAEAWAAGARGADPQVDVVVDRQAKLAADGFARLLAGQAQCVTFVREPFPSEAAAFRARFGHPPTLVPVAMGSFATRGGTHAIAVFANAANPIRGLTLAQLDAALSETPRRGAGRTAATWGDLGARGAWAARPLHVYGMLRRRASGDPPGIVNYLQQRVLLGAEFRSDLVEASDQPGRQALAAIVDDVARDPDGLGYSGFGYAAGQVRALPLAERTGAPFTEGTARTVAVGAYPLSRRIYVMVDRAPGAPLRPGLAAFLRYALSPAGQAAVAADAQGFLPLTPAEAARARKALR
jgi:phosphate transport system substrate-binding protein